MNERLRELRLKLELSQAELARQIGISQNTISYMEKENATIKDVNVKAICTKFDVNEEWLRTGKGEMFLNFDNDEAFGRAMDEIFKDEDPFIRNMIIEMASLPKEEKEAMKKAFSILKKITSK